MKKLFLTLSLLLVAVCSGMALTVDEIVGKWESSPIKHEPTPEMPMTVTEKYVIEYQADGTVTYSSEASMNIELDQNVSVDLFPRVTATGTYTVAGDSITINLTKENAKVKFTEDDVRIRGIEDASQEQMIHQSLYANMSQGMDAMLEGIGDEPEVFNNVLVFGKQMTAICDGTAVTFKRKKK